MISSVIEGVLVPSRATENSVILPDRIMLMRNYVKLPFVPNSQLGTWQALKEHYLHRAMDRHEVRLPNQQLDLPTGILGL